MDNVAVCKIAGNVIDLANVPSGDADISGEAAYGVRGVSKYAAAIFGSLRGGGAVETGLNEVQTAYQPMSSLPVSTLAAGWANYRAPLTQGVTDLQASCTAAGVPDILNQ